MGATVGTADGAAVGMALRKGSVGRLVDGAREGTWEGSGVSTLVGDTEGTDDTGGSLGL